MLLRHFVQTAPQIRSGAAVANPERRNEGPATRVDDFDFIALNFP